MYSVDTEREAKDLLTFACGTVPDGPLKGEFYARELAAEQTIQNLMAFGRRLAAAHAALRKCRGEKPAGRSIRRPGRGTKT